jgi:endonuclease YncB( thermonuclease family)
MMGKKVRGKKITADYLRKIGVPGALILGLVFASIYGVDKLPNLGPDHTKNTRVFAASGVVREVIDGDTFRLANGFDYRLIGINAPDRGEDSYKEATAGLDGLIGGKRVFLEYDRYQDDKNGRILAWVWVGCESTPKFFNGGLYASVRE